MPSKPCGDDWVAVCEFPLLYLGETCTVVFGESAIDGYMGHALGWMSEIGFGFTHALEGCWVAGLHVNAENFPSVVAHPVLQSDMAMLHASLLDVWEEAGLGWLPANALFCHNFRHIVLLKGFLSKRLIT